MLDREKIIIEAFDRLEAGTPETSVLDMYPEVRDELEGLLQLRNDLTRESKWIQPDERLLHTILEHIDTAPAGNNRPVHQDTTKHIHTLLKIIKTWFTMSNKTLVGLLAIIVITTGVITITAIAKPNPNQTPPITLSPPAPPASPLGDNPAATLANELDSMFEEDSKEESVFDEEGSSELMAGEDEIINSYDINEEEL